MCGEMLRHKMRWFRHQTAIVVIKFLNFTCRKTLSKLSLPSGLGNESAPMIFSLHLHFCQASKGDVGVR